MTHADRIKATVRGEKLDRPCYTAWGPHFSLEDQNAKDLARAMINFQNCHHFDFIKIMSSGLCFTEDFGQKIRPAEYGFDQTWMNTTVNAINDPHEWDEIKMPDFTKGAMAREIEVVKRINDYFHGEVPVLPISFSPFIWMGEMTGGFFRQDTIVHMFRRSTKHCENGLKVITEAVAKLCEEQVKAGAAGFFFGYQQGMAELMGKEMFDEYAKKPDIAVINSVKDKTYFNMAHLCNGDKSVTDWFLDYPVEAFNWYDQGDEQYSLAEMRAKTDKVLVGGLDNRGKGFSRSIEGMVRRAGVFEGTDRQEVKERVYKKVKEAMAAAGPKLVVSGGCGWSENASHRYVVWEEVMDEIEAENKASHK